MSGAERGCAPRAIVVAGPPGSGKTTLATELARCAGLALFDLDEVTGPLTRGALALVGLPEEALDENGPGRALRAGRYASLLGAAKANRAVGRSVVIAAPFSDEIAEPAAWSRVVTELAVRDRSSQAPRDDVDEQRDGVDLLVIRCDPDVLARRLRARGAARDRLKVDGARPDGARPNGARPNGATEPAVPHVVVDGNLPLAEQLASVLETLKLGVERVHAGRAPC